MSRLYYMLLPPLLLLPALMAAQYQGGSGDGHDRADGTVILMTVDLNQIYGGGAGDGYDRGDGAINLMTFDLANIYGGGSGDGFNRADGTVNLMAFDVAAIYNGGTGDGFDRADGAVSLIAFDLTNIYGGGVGDGYDRSDGTVNLMAFDVAGIYGGGAGDGYDRGDGTVNLMAFDVAGIYGGGAGDGYDRGDGTVNLMAFDVAGIYGGGAGDGYDRGDGTALLMTFNVATIYGGGAGDGHSSTTSEDASLPLTLVAFTATAGQKEVLLNWVTENEIDTDVFTVERTQDGRTFAAVGYVPAVGVSIMGEQLDYALTDAAPLVGTSFYRLRTTDLDGSEQVSELREVNFQPAAGDWSYTMYPNPNAGLPLTIQLRGFTGNWVVVTITDLQGRRVARRSFGDQVAQASVAGPLELDVARGLPAGGYLVYVSDGGAGGQGRVLVVK